MLIHHKNNNLAIAGWQVVRTERRNRANAENGLKGRFPSCRTQRRQRKQCTHTKNATHARIESVVCVAFFVCVHCVFCFFDCVASCASVALHVTAWKPCVGLCAIQLFTFLWWVSKSAVRRNVVMSNYVTSNYVTLRCQAPVCQFSWCPQRHMSPLWPVIKQQRHCGACRGKWRLADTGLCSCGETRTVSRVVESCHMAELNGGLSRLHSADEDAVLWLTSYGLWHAYYEKKIKQQGDSTSDRQTVTSDGGSRSLAWPVITLLLRTFVIGLGHFWNSRKTSHSRQMISVSVLPWNQRFSVSVWKPSQH